MMDYDAACIAAATAQGLDPITSALAAAGIRHGVEQTGGYCMVVTVAVGADIFAMTADGETVQPAAPYLMCRYRADVWHGEDGPDAVTYTDGAARDYVSLGYIVTTLQNAIGAHGGETAAR